MIVYSVERVYFIVLCFIVLNEIFFMKKGFSLIELLIVVAIVGILAAVAFPSYRSYITKARRTDGQTSLLDLANRMERYYSQNHTYATATLGTASPTTDVLTNATTPEGWYTLSIAAQTASSYTLQATPQNAQGTEDTGCQSLTFNDLGEKGLASGPAGSPTETAAECWS